jgi:Protein of unknown function (DUF669)
MVALNFNATTVAPQITLEALPSGLYPVIITKSIEKPTAAGDGSYLEIEMTITNYQTDTKMNGRKVIDRLNINNKNQTAVDIAYSTLSAICHVTNRLNINASEELHGIPFFVNVIKKRRDDQPELYQNEVKGYKDINGNDPSSNGVQQQPQQQMQQPQQAPQQPQPQQPAIAGIPPWAK